MKQDEIPRSDLDVLRVVGWVERWESDSKLEPTHFSHSSKSSHTEHLWL